MSTNYDIKFEPGDEYLQITVTGTAEIADILAILDDISNDGTFVCSRRFWNFLDCDLNFSSDELRLIAEIGKSRDSQPGKAALLVDRDLEFGQLRVHEVFRSTDDHEVSVFRDEAEALDWLLT